MAEDKKEGNVSGGPILRTADGANAEMTGLFIGSTSEAIATPGGYLTVSVPPAAFNLSTLADMSKIQENARLNALTGLLADKQIKLLCQNADPTLDMIQPFVDHQIKAHGVSYGLSSYGYDVRIGDEFKIFINLKHGIIDPSDFDDSLYIEQKSDELIIPPHGFVLATTLETFRIPDDVFIIALGKSTWARCGVVVGVTPIEPGFEAPVTLELSNTTSLPVRVKAGQGICQFVFFRGSVPCDVTYASRGGKYMGQKGPTPPKSSV